MFIPTFMEIFPMLKKLVCFLMYFMTLSQLYIIYSTSGRKIRNDAGGRSSGLS